MKISSMRRKTNPRFNPYQSSLPLTVPLSAICGQSGASVVALRVFNQRSTSTGG